MHLRFMLPCLGVAVKRHERTTRCCSFSDVIASKTPPSYERIDVLSRKPEKVDVFPQRQRGERVSTTIARQDKPVQKQHPVSLDDSDSASSRQKESMGVRILVPTMLFASSMIMALAWLGHLKFKELPFVHALFYCWLLVLPEYVLNILAIRIGYRAYTGAQMASFNLCSGVVCVALVSRFVLGEVLHLRDLAGFGLMICAMILISYKQPRIGGHVTERMRQRESS